LVENAILQGATTLVAVGNDDTLHEVINAVKGREMIFGFIPMSKSEVGEAFGITGIEQGAKTIGLRRIAELDLGMVNHMYFLSKLHFGLNSLEGTVVPRFFSFGLMKKLSSLPTMQIKLSVNGEYQAVLDVVAGQIMNLGSPNDGVLDITLLPRLSKWENYKYRRQILSGQFEDIPGVSIIHANKVEITSPFGLPLKIGTKVAAKTPAQIEILPKALKIIVGKARKF
jgi:diacylglycerol kinase family enzyme